MMANITRKKRVPLARNSASSRKENTWDVPSGWFAVARSSALKTGVALPIRYFGKDLVLFRTESGKAHVWDAHCAHNGAHLGHGGRISGECIVCPFHSWSFGPDGQCVSIPYLKSGSVPSHARMNTWTVQEVGGNIFAWHGPGAPTYAVPDIAHLPGIEGEGLPRSSDWHNFRHFKVTINSPIQAMVENMVDSIHAMELHKLATIEGVAIQEKGASLHIQFTAKHRTAGTKFPTNLLPNADSSSDGVAVGFGFQRVALKVGAALEALVVFTTTPVEHDVTELNAYTSVSKRGGMVRSIRNRAIRRAIEFGLMRELREDFVIWQNQRYPHRPVLTKSDEQLATYRHWAKQFYSTGGAASEESESKSAE